MKEIRVLIGLVISLVIFTAAVNGLPMTEKPEQTADDYLYFLQNSK